MVARVESIFVLLFMTLALSMCGCHVQNKAYRTSARWVISVPPPAPLPALRASRPEPNKDLSGDPCAQSDRLSTPCLAFIEFDDFGEVWETSPNGRPAQLSKVRALIEKARRQDPDGEPLILTFIHGWKHNAAGSGDGEEDTNITGVKAVLNSLHEKQWAGHVVIGIYLAWRGNLVSHYWPVSQQFTYFNREAAAFRVGNSSMTDALIEISDTARKKLDCSVNHPCQNKCLATPEDPELTSKSRKPCTPLLLYVGHSFGALVLERALSQAIVTRMEREWMDGREKEWSSSPPAAAKEPVPITPLADLVIFINSAAAATESKQLMDYLASSHFIYRSGNVDEPLFLSITSEADLATGLLIKVGHAVPMMAYKWNGSMRGSSAVSSEEATRKDSSQGENPAHARVCFDASSGDHAESKIKTDLSQSDYFMSTTAHKAALWSHVVKAGPVDKTSPADLKCIKPGVDAYATCHIGDHNYSIVPIVDRCNGTPYWVMQVEKEIIPDHGTIFTERLIAFLAPFISRPVNTSRSLSQSPRPELTRPYEAIQ